MPGSYHKDSLHQVVFNNYNGTYFLSKVQNGWFMSALPMSRGEKELSIATLREPGAKGSKFVITATN